MRKDTRLRRLKNLEYMLQNHMDYKFITGR